MNEGLVREDSKKIAFVSASLLEQAINIQEAHKWVYCMIEKYDELPTYMYFLMEADNWASFRKIIDFNISLKSKNTDEIYKSLAAIGYNRGLALDEEDKIISKRAAFNALKRNPEIIQYFQEVFPFIELPESVTQYLPT
jgi:hypothetical protein